MAMTLRLDESETQALRRRAALENRSMQDVARQAVRDYVERTSRADLIEAVMDAELPRVAERVVPGGVTVRDVGLLEAAAVRPQTTFGAVDAYPDLISKAAALL